METKNYFRGYIPSTDTEIIYTKNDVLRLKNMVICNVGGAEATFRLYITSSSVGAVTKADAIYYDYKISTDYNLVIPEKILPAGCRLVAKANDTEKLSINVDVEVI
jgi:hypothetical protein